MATISGIAQPALRSGIVQPAMRSGIAQPTMRSGIVQPAIRSGKAQPSIRSGKAQPAIRSAIAQPAMRSDKAQPALSISRKKDLSQETSSWGFAWHSCFGFNSATYEPSVENGEDQRFIYKRHTHVSAFLRLSFNVFLAF